MIPILVAKTFSCRSACRFLRPVGNLSLEIAFPSSFAIFAIASAHGIVQIILMRVGPIVFPEGRIVVVVFFHTASFLWAVESFLVKA
jgi:hypothetical protein